MDFFGLLRGMILIALALTDTQASAGERTRGFSASNQNSLVSTTRFNLNNEDDKGDFKIGFARQKGKKTPKMDKELGESLQGLADGLNETFALPENVYIGVTECGEPNAFYESKLRQLTMCYELYAQLDEVFKPEFPKEAERDDAVSSAFVFIFFHELGHALIDVYDLPVMGKEEDAVDGLSTWLLTDGTDSGDSMALNGAIAFALLGDEEKNLPFWDEHSLNTQRFYNTICLVYGQNPKKYGDFVKNGTLPKARAARCSAEYAQVDRAWSKLLAPYIKQ